jgi:hypothetical protein
VTTQLDVIDGAAVGFGHQRGRLFQNRPVRGRRSVGSGGLVEEVHSRKKPSDHVVLLRARTRRSDQLGGCQGGIIERVGVIHGAQASKQRADPPRAVISTGVHWIYPAFPAVVAGATLLLAPTSCTPPKRDADSARSDARQPPDDDAAGLMAARDVQPAPVPVAFACGRATARLPADSEPIAAQTRPCVDPGYGEDIEASAVAGAQSFHALRYGSCEVKLVATERVPAPGTSEERPTSGPTASGGRVELVTPEGSLFEVQVSPVTADCGQASEEVATLLAQSLQVVPLRQAGSHVRATLSTAGHGFELEVPPGFYVVASGGMADQYETSYQLRGPNGAWVTLYTSWRRAPSSPAGPFISSLIGPRARWRSSLTDLGTDTEGCRGTLGAGPDKRLKIELMMCGPGDGYAELQRLLATVRLTPAAMR